MATYISIPEPCHEDWNNMSVENQGRHCMKCCKTVIDFTSWEASDIAAYLNVNGQTKVCGRFNPSQLDTPITETPEVHLKQIFFANVSIFKKIAAIFLIAFGFSAASCHEDLKGEAIKEPVKFSVDTSSHPEMGGIKPEKRSDTIYSCTPTINTEPTVSMSAIIIESPVTGTLAIVDTPLLPLSPEENL
jgi:hypothetical protein